MLSRDPQLLDPASAVSDRIREYKNLVDDLSVLVFSAEGGFGARLLRLWQFYRLSKKKVREEVKKGSADLLITSQDPFELGMVAYLLKREYNIALQFQVHTDIFSPYFARESILNWIRLRLARFLLPKAEGIRVVSERIRASLLHSLNITNNRITVLPIFVNSGIYEGVCTARQPDGFSFLTVARLSPEKNIGLAIQALADVVQKHSETHMTIIGEGPEKPRLQSLARELGVSPHVLFPGARRTTGLLPYFSAADCFFLVSNYEGYAMAIVEAMCSGLPIVMTDVGLAGWLMRDEREGMVVPVGDKDALASAMLRMIENKDARTRYGQAALDTASKLASKEEYLAALKAAWQNCIVV